MGAFLRKLIGKVTNFFKSSCFLFLQSMGGMKWLVVTITWGAEFVWICTLMSPQSDFWYCKYDYGGSFIKRWHVGIHGRLAGVLD